MIPLPFKPKIISEEGNSAVIEIEGLFPGYGHTIGTSLRRALLSSLKGAAITSIKIKGVEHEFSTIDGVLENVVDIILNLKQLRFKMHEDGPISINLSVNGEKEVTGKDFNLPGQVEIMTEDLHIATLTSKKSELKIEATVETGLGYIPVETRSKDKVEVGVISLDAAFSPVIHVDFKIENMRVGDRTDYHKIKMFIETDGSIAPLESFKMSAQILVEQFNALSEGFIKHQKETDVPREKEDEDSDVAEKGTTAEEDALKTKLDDVKLSSRTLNALREAGIKTVGGLARKKEETLREVGGLGDKGIQEIKKALGNLGITLKQ